MNTRTLVLFGLILLGFSLPNFSAVIKVNGHAVDFEGKLSLAFRVNSQNELMAFDGYQCNEIKLDGKSYVFGDKPFGRIAFMPEDETNSSYAIFITGEGRISLPVVVANLSAFKLLGPDNKKIRFQAEKNTITFNMTPELSGKWLRLIW